MDFLDLMSKVHKISNKIQIFLKIIRNNILLRKFIWIRLKFINELKEK